MLTIVLADDHQVVRDGLRSLLETGLGCTIVGEASDAEAAIALTQRVRPDVLVVDLAMPEGGGLHTIRHVRVAAPDTRIVVLTMHNNEAHVREALRAGALAYALKESPATEFISAVQEAAAGRRYLAPQLSQRAITTYIDSLTAPEIDTINQLTGREYDVLVLASRGLSNATIAEHLVLSARTVETYRASLMRKLQLTNQTELVLYALQRGLIVVPEV